MDAYFKFSQLLMSAAGRGFVSIQNPSQYGLPEGISNDHAQPDVQVYGISMYHQLHCLVSTPSLLARKGDFKLIIVR